MDWVPSIMLLYGKEPVCVITESRYQEYVDAWNNQDIPKIIGFHDENCTYEDVAYSIKVEGLDQLQDFLIGVFKSIPDFKLHVLSYQATDVAAASEWIMSGTRNGLQFEERGSTIMEVKNNKLVRNSDYHNLGSAI